MTPPSRRIRNNKQVPIEYFVQKEHPSGDIKNSGFFVFKRSHLGTEEVAYFKTKQSADRKKKQLEEKITDTNWNHVIGGIGTEPILSAIYEDTTDEELESKKEELETIKGSMSDIKFESKNIFKGNKRMSAKYIKNNYKKFIVILENEEEYKLTQYYPFCLDIKGSEDTVALDSGGMVATDFRIAKIIEVSREFDDIQNIYQKFELYSQNPETKEWDKIGDLKLYATGGPPRKRPKPKSREDIRQSRGTDGHGPH